MHHRARSNTATSIKSRKRPLSRASTTSVQSGLTQPIDQHLGESGGEYRKQWYDPSHTQQRFGALNHQMSAEDMVLHSASQLQNPREYEIDPQLGGSSHHHPMSYPQEEPYYGSASGRQSMPADGISGNYGDDSQILEGRSDEQDDVDSLAGVGPAKKTSKSSAANELEMRQLFQANQTRTLPEVARELHGNERGPQSERTRQVFAMLW
jgi:regulatory factor X